jgi:hypothetical protein
MPKFVSDELLDELLGIDLNCANGTCRVYLLDNGKKPLLKHYARLANYLATICCQLTSVYVLDSSGVGFARLVCEDSGFWKLVLLEPEKQKLEISALVSESGSIIGPIDTEKGWQCRL